MLRFLWICFLISGAAFMVQAQEELWTLQRCIDRAEQKNISLNISALDVESADIQGKRAAHSRYPNLNGTASFGYNFGRTIDPTSNEFIATSLGFNSISLNAGMTLFAANRINNSIRQAKVNKEAALATYEQARQDLALQVANLYLNALLAKENLAIAQAQYDNTLNQLKRNRILAREGALNKATLLDFEAEEASQAQNLITAENTLQLALLQLKQALLIPADEAFDIIKPDFQINPSAYEIQASKYVYQSALITQYSIKAAELNLESARFEKRIAQAAFYPSLTLGGNLNSNYSTQGRTLLGTDLVTQQFPASFNGETGIVSFASPQPIFEDANWATQIDENLGYGFGLQLNVPIYTNYANAASYQLAKISEVRAEKQLNLREQSVRIDVERAVTDLKAASKSYRASERSFEASDVAYQNALKQFELGTISSFDLFNVQQRQQTAQQQLLLAKYDYLFRQKIVDFYLGQPIKL